MENNYKKEAMKQYLHYFRFWFMGVGILAAICIVLGVTGNRARSNHDAPAERVYDSADVLTDEEEEKLREHIARMEKKLQIDIVLVTIKQPVEGEEALKLGFRSADWEQNMQDIADDFYDANKFGYNKNFEGDGILLLHNWYEGQNGEALSPSGFVEDRFGDYEINKVFDAVDAYYEVNPYRAYKAYVDKVGDLLEIPVSAPLPWRMVLFLPGMIAMMYAAIHLSQKAAANTTPTNAYVAGGKPVLNYSADDFLRKRVTTRKIQTGSSSGGSGRHRGGGHRSGGGHHRSSSGARHGGGTRRH